MIAKRLYDVALNHHRSRLAVVDGDRRLTYGDLDERTARLAHLLCSVGGMNPVATYLPNALEFIEVDVACTRAGITRVGIGERLAGPECRYILENSGSRVLVSTPELLERLDPLPEPVTDVLLVGLTRRGRHGSGIRAMPYEDALADSSSAPVEFAVSPATPNYVLYTSGTTGFPKGATHTQAGRYVATLSMLASELSMTPRSVMVHAAPLTHGSGSKVIAVLASGGANVIMPSFEPELFARIVSEEGGTHTFLVPTMLQRIVEAGSSVLAGVAGMQQISFGGAPISTRLFERSIEALGPILTQVYGSCEAPHPITLLRPSDYHEVPDRSVLETAGRASLGVELALDGAIAESSGVEVGELLIRAPHLMAGYWGLATETESVLTSDGWYRTGDLASIDAEGFVRFLDRKRDLIISGGLNIYPSEVERVLLEHPEVAQTAVVGYPDEEWGESVCAYVVSRSETTPVAEDLIAWCRERLASYKKPRRIEFVEHLPIGASNKVLKRELRSSLWAGHDRQIN